MARINVPFVQGQLDLDLQGRSLRRSNHNWVGGAQSIAYGTGDLVVHNGSIWIAMRANDNVEPTETNSMDWMAVGNASSTTTVDLLFDETSRTLTTTVDGVSDHAVIPGGGGGTSTDTRPNIEIARSGLFHGYTNRTPLTRNPDGSLETREFTARGTNVLETFVRQSDGTLDEKVYTGSFITGLAPDATNTSLLRLFHRNTDGSLSSDEWHFGTYTQGTITAHYLIYPNSIRNAIRFSNEPAGSITQSGREVTFDDTTFTINGRDVQLT